MSYTAQQTFQFLVLSSSLSTVTMSYEVGVVTTYGVWFWVWQLINGGCGYGP